MSQNLKIVKLTAENFKKLKAVSIEPVGNVVEITGANEQGKSSVLDAIWAAVDAAGCLKETKTKEPIRHGEKRATIVLDLGEFTITRKFLPSGQSVEITNKEGFSAKSPQTILDSLIGKISFDPLAFSHMEEKKQKELLLSLVKIEIDLQKNAADRQTAYEERTVVNRQVKELEGQLSGLPVQPAETPDEELKTEDILNAMAEDRKVEKANEEKRQELREFITYYQEKNREAEQLEEKSKQILEQIEGLQLQIQNLQTQVEETNAAASAKVDELAEMKTKGAEMHKAVDALKDPDMSVYETRLAELETTNKAVRLKKQRAGVEIRLSETRKKSQSLSETIDALDTTKNNAIKAAAFPIDGLGFDDNGVLYKGVPFTQCSSAERLRVSLAIAMALSPQLRVIRITDGSLLDSKNMSIIKEMANSSDFQIWIEKVDESGQVGVVIEDGEVANG